MKNIAFYISNHGFGHAARNIPIIKELLKHNDIKVFIKSGEDQIEFIKQSLEEHLSKVALFNNEIDVGLILKAGSLSIDEGKLKEELSEYMDSWTFRIEAENKFISENNIDLLISDIVPWVFKSAKKLNVRSLFISNFTWVEIYEKYFDNDIYDRFLECYKLADRAFLFELYNDKIKKYFIDYDFVGLSLREFDIEKAEAIKRSFDKPIIFVSVGRSVEIRKEIIVGNIPYIFVVTEGIRLVGNNVHYLSKDIPNTQDYILASEYVIIKAGWGTVAEALCAEKPMAVIERDFIEEDRVTAKKLNEMGMAIKIKENELYDINGVIDKLKAFKYNKNNYKFVNDSENIAKKIEAFLRGDSDE